MNAPANRNEPALAGGPMFPEGLPLARPRVPDPAAVGRQVERILSSGEMTNGTLVRELEHRAAEYLDVRHCVAVASCTAGLMLVLRAADLSGDVVVPSFTFAATAHAVAWNGLRPVFADVDPLTLTLSPAAVERAISLRTSAVLATHVYGTPCDIEGLDRIATRAGVRLFFDAAHAFGSEHAGVQVGGFGDAEVFSLSPTKILLAAEGGLIATDDDILAERCRIGRDYGNPGDYDCRLVGMNARMSELHAAVALDSFTGIDERIARRNELAAAYRRVLEPIPGISLPVVPAGDLSTYKDLTVLVDAEGFGLDADGLAAALAAEGVETRRYYSPPVHTMRAYRGVGHAGPLPNTDAVSAAVLTLPLWPDMADDQVERVGLAIERIRRSLGAEKSPRGGAEKIRRTAGGLAGRAP